MIDFMSAAEPDAAGLRQQELSFLQTPNALSERLAYIDFHQPFRRLFVMGCGRSGTWLLTALLSTYSNVDILAEEVPFETFGLVRTNKAVLILKRDHASYQRVAFIPANIEIIYIMRHPFDVLTSHNPVTSRAFHVSPERWLGEMDALRFLMETQRAKTTLLRYEDLVRQPVRTQVWLSERLNLAIAQPPSEIIHAFKPDSEPEKAMRGIRPIDTNSIGSHRHDPIKLAHLKQIRPQLENVLEWVGNAFDYKFTLD